MTSRLLNPSTKEPSLPFLVAGIGASAGGLEALQAFFECFTVPTGIAFIVVQHLSPDFESMMVELLSRRTSLPVMDAEDGTRVAPGMIYLLPPKKDIEIAGGVLKLRERGATGLHMPIDRFFESLATDQGEMAAAVVLSGTGSDGSRGIVSVRKAGGLAMAQSVETAKFDGMPNAAFATGMVDYVGSPSDLADLLKRRSRAETDASVPDSLPALEDLFEVVRNASGLDFSKYKDGTVSRRIRRRMLAQGAANLDDYVYLLRQNPAEVNQLRVELLIGVSSLFRDLDSWLYLRDEVLRDVVQDVDARPFRAWVTACSTGEEAYTLAIVLHEVFRELGRAPDFKIFATDISAEAIRHASDGVYSEAAVDSLAPAWRQRYFDQAEGGYRVKRLLRERITFATHNLLADPPFTRLHFVSCRNLLIYFKPDVQRDVLSRIHFGMLSGATLFLGSSETVGELAPSYNVMSIRHKVFTAVGTSPMFTSTSSELLRPTRPRATVARPGSLEHLYDTVLKRFVPPGVATDHRFDIMHVFGEVAPYLSLAEGRISTNLLRMVSPAASVLLHSAGARARETDEPIRLTGVPIGEHLREVKVQRYTRAGGEAYGYLVFFVPSSSSSGALHDIDVDAASHAQIQQLSSELDLTREHLRTAVQDLEASNEELQTTNEELVASNEELQSTNEELQSVNEELHTVNSEHQEQIVELSNLSDDLTNLLRLIDIGTVFLNEALVIQRYNQAVTAVLPIQPHDVGRRVQEIKWHVDYPQFEEDAHWALASSGERTRDLEGPDGRVWRMRVQPYVRSRGVGGVLLTVLDVTDLRQKERELAEQVELQAAVAEVARVGIAILDPHKQHVSLSSASLRVLELSDTGEVTYDQFVHLLEGGTDVPQTLTIGDREVVLRVFARPAAGSDEIVVAFQRV